jgi:hypothetical protein
VNLPHNFPPNCSKIHSNIIIPFTPRSSKWSLSFSYPDENFIRISHLSHPSFKLRSSYRPWFDHPNNVWWNKLRSSSLCSLLNSSATSFPFGPVTVPTLRSLVPSIYIRPLVRERERERRRFTPYKTTVKLWFCIF